MEYEYRALESDTRTGLTSLLNDYAKEYWEPILLSEKEGRYTIILRRVKKY